MSISASTAGRVRPILCVAIVIMAAGLALAENSSCAAEPAELPVGDTKVFSLAFSPDGKHLAVGTGGQTPTVKVFDVSAKKELRDIPCEGRGAAFSVAFSRDGKLLAIADYNLNVTVRNLTSGAEVAGLPGDPERKTYRQARRLAFTPDGKGLVSGYSTGDVYAWDIAGKQVTRKFNHGHEITALAVSPDGRRVATGTDFGLRLWDTGTGNAAVSLDRKSSGEHQVQAIAFTPDGKTVITADSPGFVRFFATDDGQELRKFKMPSVGSETTVYGLNVTSDGKTAVVPGLLAGRDPKRPNVLSTGIILLDVATARPRAFVESVAARVLALSPDNKLAALATGDSGDPVFLYNLTAAVPVKP